MWLWGTILVIVAAVALVVIVVDRRRGSTGASRSLDSTTDRSGAQYRGELHGPMSSGGGGDGGG